MLGGSGKVDKHTMARITRAVKHFEQTPRNKVVPPQGHRSIAGKGLKVYEGALLGDLAAPEDGQTGATTADARKWVKDPDNEGNMKDDDGDPITLTNRDVSLEGSEGDYVLWTKVNGENRPLRISCGS